MFKTSCFLQMWNAISIQTVNIIPVVAWRHPFAHLESAIAKVCCSITISYTCFLENCKTKRKQKKKKKKKPMKHTFFKKLLIDFCRGSVLFIIILFLNTKHESWRLNVFRLISVSELLLCPMREH